MDRLKKPFAENSILYYKKFSILRYIPLVYFCFVNKLSLEIAFVLIKM